MNYFIFLSTWASIVIRSTTATLLLFLSKLSHLFFTCILHSLQLTHWYFASAEVEPKIVLAKHGEFLAEALLERLRLSSLLDNRVHFFQSHLGTIQLEILRGESLTLVYHEEVHYSTDCYETRFYSNMLIQDYDAVEHENEGEEHARESLASCWNSSYTISDKQIPLCWPRHIRLGHDFPEVVEHRNVDTDATYENSVNGDDKRLFIPSSDTVIDEHTMMVEFFHTLVTKSTMRSQRFPKYKARFAFSILINRSIMSLLNFLIPPLAFFFQFFDN